MKLSSKPPIRLHEVRSAGSSAECFDSQGPRAGEQVQNSLAFDCTDAKYREYRPSHSFRGGPQPGALRRSKSAATMGASCNASGHRLTDGCAPQLVHSSAAVNASAPSTVRKNASMADRSVKGKSCTFFGNLSVSVRYIRAHSIELRRLGACARQFNPICGSVGKRHTGTFTTPTSPSIMCKIG